MKEEMIFLCMGCGSYSFANVEDLRSKGCDIEVDRIEFFDLCLDCFEDRSAE